MTFLQIALLVGLSSLLQTAVAEEYTVGGRAGWQLRNVDYTQWSARNAYRAGDSLLFPYDQGTQSVMRVSQEDFHLCKTNKPIEHYTDGNTIVRLDGDSYYFISGVPGHCNAGMKLAVILAGASPSGSPSSSPVVSPSAGVLSPTPSPPAPSPSPALSSPSPAPTARAPTSAPFAAPLASPTIASPAPVSAPIASPTVASPAPVSAASTPVPAALSPSPETASPPSPLAAPSLSPTVLTPSPNPLASSPPAPSILPPAEGPAGALPPSAASALSSTFASFLITAVIIASSFM